MEWAEIFSSTKEFEYKGLAATIKRWPYSARSAILLQGAGCARRTEKDGWTNYQVDIEMMAEQNILVLLHGLQKWNLPDAVSRESVFKFLSEATPEYAEALVMAVRDFNILSEEKKTS